MIVTNDGQRAEKLKVLRAHGAKPKYYHKVIGGNFRLDEIQAAVVSVKLRHLDSWTAGRQKNAKLYDQLFKKAGLPVGLPAIATDRHILNQYVVRLTNRNEVQAFLKEKGIGTEVYYPVPLHLQECFAYLGYKRGAFAESERAAEETLALPVYPELAPAQLEYVVETFGVYFERSLAAPATSSAQQR